MLGTEALLTTLLLIAAGGALVLVFVPIRKILLLRGIALFFTTITFLCSLLLVTHFDSGIDTMQFVQSAQWFDVGILHVQYHVGIDGISLFLVILTTFLMPLAILASWNIEEKVKSYMCFMLLLEVGMIGVFVSLDLILFYIFWEVMLIPMYFLIGVWGGAAPHLRSSQIFHLHHGWFLPHVGRHSHALLLQ